MIRRPPRSTLDRSSAASDVYKRQVGEHRVKAHDFLHRDVRTAERQREPIVVLVTRECDTAAFEELVKRRMRELCGKRNRGHIATARERLASFDWPDKVAVKVLRVVTVKALRRILEHAQRVNQSLVDRECEDERLECGAW